MKPGELNKLHLKTILETISALNVSKWNIDSMPSGDGDSTTRFQK
jgi:hypothetical protein